MCIFEKNFVPILIEKSLRILGYQGIFELELKSAYCQI